MATPPSLRVFRVLILVLFLVFPAQAREGLEITRIHNVGIAPEPPYVNLEVAFPRGFDQPEAAISVNGSPAVFRPIGGGYSQEVQFRDFTVYLGPPGPKEITVTLTSGGRKLSVSRRFDFRSRGDILPLGHFSGEGVFSQEELQFYVYFLKDLRARVNGREQPFSLRALPRLPDFQLLSLTPSLRPGANVIEIQGRNYQGEERRLDFKVVFLPDRTIKVGEVFWFPFGKMGSKSGPFYRLEIEGPALHSLGQEFKPRLLLKDGLWLGGENLFCRQLKAAAPGEATLKIFEKKWFTLPFSLKETLSVKVIP